MENNNSSQKEIVVVKQKSGCLTKFVLMLVALLLIIILFPFLCGIGILGGLGGLVGAGSLCAISQSTTKRDVKYPKSTVTPYPQNKSTSQNNIILKSNKTPDVRTPSVKISETVKKREVINFINPDFTLKVEDNKTIRFENVLWNLEKSKEIKQFLNQLIDKPVRIYYCVEKTSSMGDYQIKKDSKNNLLIEDIRYKNNSIMDELKERKFVF